MIEAAQPALSEGARLFFEDGGWRRAGIFDHAVIDGGAIFFEDENDFQFFGCVGGDGEADGVGALGWQAIASAAGAAPVAQIALNGFGGLEGFGCAADAAIRLDQGKAWGVQPVAGVEQVERFKIRAGHTISPSHASLHQGMLAPLEPTRIEILNQLLAANPSNTFARYGLAMEYVKAGELERAMKEFDAVLATDGSYAAAYFHGGQALEKLGRMAEAREYYRRGIGAARDPHARSELQGALDILGDE